MHDLTTDHEQILGALALRGLVTSADLQAATGKSQPTVSRLLSDLSSRVLALGRGRATRYALPKSIHGLPSRQPIQLTHEDGRVEQFGTLSFLQRDLVHVESGASTSVTAGALPWFLSSLRPEGFLGSLHAQALAARGLDRDPQRWGVESILFAALHLHDGIGALTIGDHADPPVHRPLPGGAGLGAWARNTL